MIRTTNKLHRPIALAWILTIAGLIVVGATSAGSEGAFGQSPGMRQKRQGLTPVEERKDVKRPPMRPAAGAQFEPLSEQDLSYLRLVPKGVALPRVLIRVFRQLDLNEEQQARLEQLARRSGDQVPALNRLRKAQSELLDEALYGETFEPALIEKRASDLAATQGEIIKLQARLMSQIRQILRPEQGVKFRDLLTRERERLVEEGRQQNQSQNPSQNPLPNRPPDQP